MKWWTDKFCEELKNVCRKKRELVAERNELSKKVNAGKLYFSNETNHTPEAMQKGIKQMIKYLDQIEQMDKDINDIDTIIVSKCEAYLGNFIATARMPQRMNDAGDVIQHDKIYAVPFKSDYRSVIEVTPDDIWFLKMIKDAFKCTNITFESKSEI